MATVSVIVATYRRDLVLSRALISLAEQTYTDFEIILVDDNDHNDWNDKIAGLVKEFISNHPNISIKYIVNHPNLGSAKARNVGIDAASGDYICFLDDDDIYSPDRIKNQLLPMINAGAQYSITDLALYSENDKLIEIRKREYIKDTSAEQMLKYHLMHHITGTDTMMFCRNYLSEIGGFSHIDMGDEFYLMQKAIEHGGAFLYVPVCDVKAYVHVNDSGLSIGDRKISGENELYTHKKKYFHLLDKKTIRYIKMRHHAVLAFSYLRTKEYIYFFKEAFLSFMISPLACMKLLLGARS